MGTARRVAIALSLLLAAALAAAAWALWPLVHRSDAALIEYVQRDVAWGWLLLQAAVPLFVTCLLAALGSLALTWRLGRHPTETAP